MHRTPGPARVIAPARPNAPAHLVVPDRSRRGRGAGLAKLGPLRDTIRVQQPVATRGRPGVGSSAYVSWFGA